MRLRAESIAAEAGENCRLEIGFRRRGRQVDVRVGHRVDQRPEQLRAADRGAALRADIGGEAIEEDDLAVEEDDGDLGPGLVMDRRSTGSER